MADGNALGAAFHALGLRGHWPRLRRNLRALCETLTLAALLTVPQTGLGESQLRVSSGEVEIVVERFPAEGCHLLIWLPSMYDEEELERDFVAALPDGGMEAWWSDLVDAHFLPRSVRSYDEVPPSDVAAVISAAIDVSDRKIALMASGRGALAAFAGAVEWVSKNPEEGRFLGVVVMFPDVYAYPPAPGEMPVFHPVLDDVPISIRFLEPEYSPRYLWLDLTVEHLRGAGADVQVRYLPRVRAGFHFEPEPTAREIELQSGFPALLRETLSSMGSTEGCTGQ